MRPIFLFSHSYPYGRIEESFLSAEIEIASKKEIDLTIFPLRRKNYRRDLPLNIKLNSSLTEISLNRRILVFLGMISNILFWKIPFQEKRSPRSLKNYYYAFKYLYGSFLIKYFIISMKNVFTDDAIFYSYWFNHTSLGAVLAKLHDPFFSNIKIITRAHRYDVFEDIKGLYFPYRTINLKHIDNVFTVSYEANLYLRRKYSEYGNKISVSRLGTLQIEHHQHSFQPYTFSFLSCSSVIPIKRVELIYVSIFNYAVDNPQKRIKWTHIGSGSGFNDLQNLVRNNSLPNFEVELSGIVENNIVREILAKNKFDIFINLSLIEGVPVSIMEAISVGIPILATDVGGSNEIVTSQTGLLVSVDFTQDIFNLAVNKIISSGESLKKSAYNFYLENYSAEENFSEFYDNLLN